jgi:hypothetical protein
LGEGPQCPFDTINGGAVWIPDEYQVNDLEKTKGKPQHTLKIAMVKSAIRAENCRQMGDVWAIVLSKYRGTEVETDYYGGYYGLENAQREAISLIGE